VKAAPALVATLLVSFSCAAADPAVAWAAPRKAPSHDAETESARLKREADALMDSGKLADALAVYQRAYELSADPALLYNQGRALEAMGEYPDALDRLEQFEREASPELLAKVPGLEEHIADLRGRLATVLVRSNVRGARVLVREKAVGSVDGELSLRTRAGPATVEVVADGYEPFKGVLVLPGGATTTLDAILSPRKKDALLVVRTRPIADIVLEGKPLGRAPLEVRVAAGTYDLAARAPGYRDERITMTVGLGDRREIDLELRKSPPVTARWWFWTGLAVVVAGGAAAAFALTTERSPSSGTFQPGQVPGP
jgi:hypothetical protein